MWTIVGGAARVAWSYLAPTLGPIVVRVAPWLATLWPGFSLDKLLRGAGLVLLFAAVACSVWWLSRPDENAVPMVAVSAVEAQQLKAQLKAKDEALAKSKETLRLRDVEAELADTYIKTLEAEKEALRAQSSDPDTPVFSADDPWLLERRRH